MERKGIRFLEDGREWRLLGLLYADDLVLCGESQEDLRFVEVCRRRGLKVNKVMMLNGEEGLECELCVDGTRLEHASECILDESGEDEAECRS